MKRKIEKMSVLFLATMLLVVTTRTAETIWPANPNNQSEDRKPNTRVRAESLPNDPYWSLQWGLKKIEADWAWNATFGNSSILVAVIDSGIDYTHPDLAANYVGLGYDWINNDADPMDDFGHGTRVAGIIAAQINNEIGIAGLAQVKIMAEKVFDNTGGGYVDQLANGIKHATDKGANIISVSLSTDSDDPLLYSAVKYAYEKNVLLVAAAGNEASDAKRYPAAYDEVIAVTATNESDQIYPLSNYGNWIELAAPGVDIFSTDLFDKNLPPDYQYYRWGTGTSFACPHVSGLAALVWSEFPNATRDWIRARLKETADDLGTPGFDNYYGYGRINARKAIYGASPAINYTLAITTTVGGTTDPAPGNYTYSERQNVSVQAIPDTGYSLDYWEVDGENVGSASPYWVSMESNHTLEAVFVLSYTLTITTTPGGVTSPSPGSYLYDIGTNVSVTATPDIYYMFDHWELDEVNIGSINPYLVLMDNNYTLYAVFVQISYTLTITATAGGTTSPVAGVYTYTAGSSTQVTAFPNIDCTLDYWELDSANVGIANPLSLTIEANHTLKAVFRPSVRDIAVREITLSKTVVGQGYLGLIMVTVENQGDFAETFNVTAYYDETAIIIEQWPDGGNSQTFWSMGDVNRDGYIDNWDAYEITHAFGSHLGDPRWNPDFDINGDGVVNMKDIGTCDRNFGKDIWSSFGLTKLFETQRAVTLPSGNSSIITFRSNTTGSVKGNYTISAHAWPVPGETDTADNTLMDGMIYVGIPGDINGDGIVDIYDAITLANAYDSKLYDAIWNANADINSDANVDIYDALILAGNYGKTA